MPCGRKSSYRLHNVSIQVEKYRYFDPETVGLDFEGMLEDIRNAPEGSIILLHGALHATLDRKPSQCPYNVR